MIMNPKHSRYAALLKDLIDEAVRLQSLYPIPSEIGLPPIMASSYSASRHRFRDRGLEPEREALSQDPDEIRTKERAYSAWSVRVSNALKNIFGAEGAHWRAWSELQDKRSSRDHDLVVAEGILVGALADLEGGYLLDQETFLAGEVLDSVLERAQGLLSEGHLDCAAVLTRVAMEDGLRRLARRHGIDDTKKAAAINDDLRNAKVYNQPLWRRVQAALDPGNAAAHGKAGELTEDDVKFAMETTSSFLVGHFSTH